MKSHRAFACSFGAAVALSHANAHYDPHSVRPNVHDPVEMDAAPLERREADEDTSEEVAADVGTPVRVGCWGLARRRRRKRTSMNGLLTLRTEIGAGSACKVVDAANDMAEALANSNVCR